MDVFFLGTNGWFASRTGNTVCTAIKMQDRLVVLDSGDGFSKLPALMKRLGAKKADVFLSHLHIDHIQGLHSLPLMPAGFKIRIFAHKSYLRALSRFLDHPYTATPEEEYADVRLFPIRTGENKVPYRVRALPLKHIDPCFGFRFSLEGKEIAYCTDTGPCGNLGKLAAGTDALIAECALLPGAGIQKEWPHLSPEMAALQARSAGAKLLILTHFDAFKYSSLSQRIAAKRAAKKIFKNTVSAMDSTSARI
jgi:ribonuclease BN (tRNA processing enzyme)